MRALSIALILFTTPLGAQNYYEDIPFTGYAQTCGYDIRIEATPNLSKAQIEEGGTPVIIIDPTLLAPRQGFHRTFLIAHECAHHKMKHTSRAGLAKRFTTTHGIRDQEMSADCWAAETLTRIGMMPPLMQIADQFFRRGFVSPGGGYPSGIQRSNVIRHCARIAVEEMKQKSSHGSSTPRLWHPAER